MDWDVNGVAMVLGRAERGDFDGVFGSNFWIFVAQNGILEELEVDQTTESEIGDEQACIGLSGRRRIFFKSISVRPNEFFKLND